MCRERSSSDGIVDLSFELETSLAKIHEKPRAVKSRVILHPFMIHNHLGTYRYLLLLVGERFLGRFLMF